MQPGGRFGARGTGQWKSLKYLDVQETKVTEKGLAELRSARPGIKDPQRRHSAAAAAALQPVDVG